MPDDRRFLTINEAAEELGVDRRRIRELIKRGILQVTENPLDRREKLISHSDIEDLRPFVRPVKKAAA